ncbi:MAG: NAD(P)H-dependent oxidoreductase [Phycisphaerae bacterium]|nr:NAD(P)H-dependent oxidoreductase [Phycisphaerae bacterium]
MPATHAAPADIVAHLSTRYATKKFDPTRSIPSEHWAALEQSLVLSPSSFGLQPWKFVVVKDKSTRERLKAASWNQSQITDASHLVVLCRRSPVTATDIGRLMERTTTVRGTPSESLAGYRDLIEGFISQPGFDSDNWSARQVYLALGFFLAAAAHLGIDACPMEGFDPAAYDEILGLPASGYRATVVVTVGYRAADDGYAHAKKVRFPREDVVEYR